ncbi:hypothetical protein FOL47_008883 [Perkinsus chesapeaki]|uniref:KATNIP domain-containing protein n=1 Tax=Perkinsus chesapeaki TaxID=330153 RepID=A0A7J6LBB3_PERCH|nr:hypothetical protein FOL47_008883 [Perkinsus chesapeaki]
MSDLITPSLSLLPDDIPQINRTAIAVHLCILENGYCPAEPVIDRDGSGGIVMKIVPKEWLREGIQVFSSRYFRLGANGREISVKMVPTGSGKIGVHACKSVKGEDKEVASGTEVDEGLDNNKLDGIRKKVADMMAKLDPLPPMETRKDEGEREANGEEIIYRDDDNNPHILPRGPPNIIRDPTTGAGGAGGLLVGPRDPLFTGGVPPNGPGSLQPRWDPMGPAGFDGEPDFDHEVPPQFRRPPQPGKGFGGNRGGFSFVVFYEAYVEAYSLSCSRKKAIFRGAEGVGIFIAITENQYEVGFVQAGRDIDRIKKGKPVGVEEDNISRSMPNLHTTTRPTTSSSSVVSPPKRRRKPKRIQRRRSSSDFEIDMGRTVTVMGRTVSEKEIDRLGNPKMRVLAKVQLNRRYKMFNETTIMSIPSQSGGFVDIKTLQRECVRLNLNGSSSAQEVMDDWNNRISNGMKRSPIRRRLDAAAARLSGSPATPSNRYKEVGKVMMAPSRGKALRKSVTIAAPLGANVDYIGRNRRTSQLSTSVPDHKIRQVQCMADDRERRIGEAFLRRHRTLGNIVIDDEDILYEPMARSGTGHMNRSATVNLEERARTSGASTMLMRAQSFASVGRLAPKTDMSVRQLTLWQKQWLRILSAAAVVNVQRSILRASVPIDVRLWRVFVIGIYALRFKSTTRRFQLSRKRWTLAVNACVRFLRPLWKKRRKASAAELIRRLMVSASQAGQLSLAVKRLLWNTRRLQRLWRQFHSDLQETLRTKWIPGFIKVEHHYLMNLYKNHSSAEISVKKAPQGLIEEWQVSWERANQKARTRGSRVKGRPGEKEKGRRGRKGRKSMRKSVRHVASSPTLRKSVMVGISPSAPTLQPPDGSGARRMSRVNQQPSNTLAVPQQQGGRRGSVMRGGGVGSHRSSILMPGGAPRRGSRELLGLEAEEMMANVGLAQLKARVDAAVMNPVLRYGLLATEFCRRMRNKAIAAKKLIDSMNDCAKHLRDWVQFARLFHLDGQSASLLLVPTTDFDSGMHGDGNESLDFTAASLMEFIRQNHELYGSSLIARPKEAEENRRESTGTLDLPGNRGGAGEKGSDDLRKKRRSRAVRISTDLSVPEGPVTNLKDCFALAKVYERDLWRQALEQEAAAMEATATKSLHILLMDPRMKELAPNKLPVLALESQEVIEKEKGFDLYSQGGRRYSNPPKERRRGRNRREIPPQENEYEFAPVILAAAEDRPTWGMETVRLKTDDGLVTVPSLSLHPPNKLANDIEAYEFYSDDDFEQCSSSSEDSKESDSLLKFAARASSEELSELRKSLSNEEGNFEGSIVTFAASVSSLRKVIDTTSERVSLPTAVEQDTAIGGDETILLDNSPGHGTTEKDTSLNTVRESVDTKMLTLNASLSRKTFEALKSSESSVTRPRDDIFSKRPISAADVLPPMSSVTDSPRGGSGSLLRGISPSEFLDGLVTARRQPGIGPPADTSVTVPVLPQGRVMEIVIHSTWGDENLVGLNGIELFDSKGRRVVIGSGSVSSTLKAVEVIGEGKSSGAMLMNLVREPYLTQDDLHSWLALFQADGDQRITIDLGTKPVCLAMVRLWNYNKSRLYAARGVRNITILLDRVPIFTGEIKQGPGEVSRVTECCEHILFTEDPKILTEVEDSDWIPELIDDSDN